jgi:TonB family protein
MLIRICFFALSCVLFSFLLSNGSRAQQPDSFAYVGMFQRGEFDKAVPVLKQITKENPSDGQAFYYLGLSYLRLEHEKDAVKALEKAREISPNSATIRTALAYGYLLRNDKRASNEAYEALKLDDKLPLGHYVIAVTNLRDGIYNSAYERAKRAVELDPNFSAAYSVKSQALVSCFAKQSGTVLSEGASRGSLLTEAVGDLEKYLSLTQKTSDKEYYSKYLESLRFFAEYYSRPEHQRTGIVDTSSNPANNVTPLNIISKPRAAYTDRARQALVSGTVVVLVGMSEDGTVKHVMVVRSLGYGLDEAAVSAARQIKFQPKMIDGKPVSVVKTIEYNFNIY